MEYSLREKHRERMEVANEARKLGRVADHVDF
jgi:hypothetical protein